MSKQQHFTMALETGFFGYSGQSMGQLEIAHPPVCSTCSCGSNSLKLPHAPDCTFGKPIKGA